MGKGEDDGTIFSVLLKSSRFPSEQRASRWEVLQEILEKYKVRIYAEHLTKRRRLAGAQVNIGMLVRLAVNSSSSYPFVIRSVNMVKS